METSAEASKHKLSHLPWLRFTSVVTAFVALDCLICVSLWIAGGDSLYMEDSVTQFSFTHSTFDLACVSLARCIILIICFYYLEQYSLLKASVGEDNGQRLGNRVLIFCQLGILLISGLSFTYAGVKGSLILKGIVQGTWNKVGEQLHMHITYEVLCIVSIVFPGVEVILGYVSSWCLRRMIKRKRLRMLVNLDEEDRQTQVKKKADIKRIILLAKPVS